MEVAGGLQGCEKAADRGCVGGMGLVAEMLDKSFGISMRMIGILAKCFRIIMRLNTPPTPLLSR